MRNQADDESFEGEGEDHQGHFTVTGHFTPNADCEGTVTATFTKSYDGCAFPYDTTIHCQGTVDRERMSLTGYWGYFPNYLAGGTFRFGRTPVFFFRFRYTAAQFERNAARARWLFASRAVKHLVRRRLWAWCYFAGRFAERRRFITLYIRRETDGRLGDADLAEWRWLAQSLYPADRRFYASLARRAFARLCVHRFVVYERRDG